MDNWDQRMFGLAHTVAQWSTHRKTKVGAVLFDPYSHTPLASGWNQLAEGLDPNDERFYQAPLKNHVWEHAERRCLYTATKFGTWTRYKGMAVNWYPCADCARSIVEFGIKLLVAEEPEWDDPKWGNAFLAAREILKAGGVLVVWVTGSPNADEPTLEAANPVSDQRADNLIHFPGVLTPEPIGLEPIPS